METVKKNKGKIILVVLALVLVGAGFWIYSFLSPLRSLADLETFRNMDPNIKVEETARGVLLDTGDDSAMVVFYPGARIEPAAYVPLLFNLAEKGINSFIIKMPLNMAVLDADAFNDVYEKYHEKSWFLMGHSLGGAMGANFAADEADKINGLILLAAYPTKSIKETGVPILSIYGNRDGVLNMEKYVENKENWPEDSQELVIQGGNHAGFGDYGEQQGDNKADITDLEQQKQTATAIEEFIRNHE